METDESVGFIFLEVSGLPQYANDVTQQARFVHTTKVSAVDPAWPESSVQKES